jgi:hypothetical protein
VVWLVKKGRPGDLDGEAKQRSNRPADLRGALTPGLCETGAALHGEAEKSPSRGRKTATGSRVRGNDYAAPSRATPLFRFMRLQGCVALWFGANATDPDTEADAVK